MMRMFNQKKSVSMKKDTNYSMEHCPVVSGIVLNIPHSSTRFPSQKDADAWPPAIRRQIDRWTDWYTDDIFVVDDPRVLPIIFPYSRFYCDAERLPDDPLEVVGQGIFYKRYEGLTRLWTEKDRKCAMSQYQLHMERLAEAITSPNTFLIDCHSFPEDLSDVDICIGINNDWSLPTEAMIDFIMRHFRHAGYQTEINTPYSNSITPSKSFCYKSLMIEVNKRVYLTDSHQPNLSQMRLIKRTIRNLYDELLALRKGHSE